MKNAPTIPFAIPQEQAPRIVRELSSLDVAGKRMYFDVLTAADMARQPDYRMTLEAFFALGEGNMHVRARVQEEPVAEIIVATWIEEARATHFLWMHFPHTEETRHRIADIMEKHP